MQRHARLKAVAAPHSVLQYPNQFDVRVSLQPPREVRWSCHPSLLGDLLLGFVGDAVWRIDFARPDVTGKLAQWQKHFPKTKFVRDSKPGTAFMTRLFAAKRSRTWQQPVVLHGTPFQVKVWRALGQMKANEITTYGALAKRIKHPKAVRAVGNAVGKNPLTILFPCHRVMASDGTLNGYASGLPTKRKVLQAEGWRCSTERVLDRAA